MTAGGESAWARETLGLLARVHPHWVHRPGQDTMAAAIDKAIRDRATLLIDAPPGWGKSFAALVPIAARDGAGTLRAMYATGTIALQEQLLRKDIPLVQRAFGGPQAALLKGFTHYLCRVKHARWAEGRALIDERGDARAFARWVAETATGDHAELDAIPSWWGDVGASHEDCIGRKCAHYPHADSADADEVSDGDPWTDQDERRIRGRLGTRDREPGPPCFAVLARWRALAATLTVANHHALLFLERFSQARVPPLVVIDEGHKLPEAASHVYGAEMGEMAFYRRTDRLRREFQQRGLVGMIEDAERAYRALLDELPLPHVAAPDALVLPTHLDALGPFHAALDALGGELEKIGGDHARLEQVGLASVRATVDRIMLPNPEHARWVEAGWRERRFCMAPVETGPMLAPLFAPERGPRIMMSATLAAGGSFAPIERACGITSARHLQLPSGFDYARQMRYFLPTPPLNPRDDEQGYLDETGRRLRELVIASSGRALILCTAFTQVEAMSEALRGIRYTVLVGDRFASPKALADAFRSDLHSVLIGTLRFWEGFDVPGEACSLVAIVRLPFERRDPLTEARYAAAEREGRSWFNDLALPDAMLMLRQGVGRGIRTSTDRAVVAILDGRIDLRQYGRAMLEALPRTAILRRVDAVAAFLASP